MGTYPLFIIQKLLFMKSYRSLFLLIISLFLFSCHREYAGYQGADIFGFEDFKKIEKLQGKVLNFDTLVMQPTEVHVLDSILFIVESMDDKLVHLYNLNTRKQIGTRITHGQGPQDMILPVVVSMNKDTLYLADMMLSTLRKYSMDDFLINDSPSYISEVKLEKRMYIDAAILNDKIWAYLYVDSCILSEFDLMDGKQTSGGLQFPQSTIKYSDVERRDAFYMSVASNDIDRMTIAYSYTDLLEFYNGKGELVRRIHGPELFFSYFQEFRDGRAITTKMDRERNREAYFSPYWVKDSLFVLYDGERVNAPDHDSNSNWLFTFTKDGKPEIAYQLDIPLFRCCVDSKARKIYGISIYPEYQIVEYSY